MVDSPSQAFELALLVVAEHLGRPLAAVHAQLGIDANGQPIDSETLSALFNLAEKSAVGRLTYRYKQRLAALRLPEDGFRTREEANAAARLSKNYAALCKAQVALGFEPSPKPDNLKKAEALRMAFERKEKKRLSSKPPRPRGRPPGPQVKTSEF
jgi:hypothetical protein